MTILTFYDFCLRSNPLATKMLTNLAICCTGDTICQGITRYYKPGEADKEWDYARTARFGAVGACVQTTLLHWYLTRIVPNLTISKNIIANPTLNFQVKVFMRCAIHVTTLLPFRIGIVFFALSTLQHMSFEKGYEGLVTNFMDGLKASYSFWPLVLLGMYGLVPPLYRNLWFDSFNLLWAVALSYIANREHGPALNDNAVKHNI